MRKLWLAIKVGFKSFKIRLLGDYKHNVWDGEVEYCVFIHKGKTYYLVLSREETPEES